MVFQTFKAHKVYNISERYNIDWKDKKKVLGRGSQGQVFLGTTKYKLFDKIIPFEDVYREGSLLERTEAYSKENKRNKRKGLVAIKQIFLKDMPIDDYWRINEARFILNMPYHPSLIQYHEMFLDDSNHNFRFTLVMEPMESDIFKLMSSYSKDGKKSLPEKLIQNTMAQVIDGLRHIHKEGFIHRDIKVENIMISPTAKYYKKGYWCTKSCPCEEYVAKLGDYGLCKYKGDSKYRMNTEFGTHGYRAPELLMGEIHYYDEKVDIWAIGVTLLEMCILDNRCGVFQKPRRSDTGLEIIPVLKGLSYPHSNTKYGEYQEVTKYLQHHCIYYGCQMYSDPVEKYVTNEELKDVIRACLQWDPKNRVSAEGLAQMPFFKGTVLNPA